VVDHTEAELKQVNKRAKRLDKAAITFRANLKGNSLARGRESGQKVSIFPSSSNTDFADRHGPLHLDSQHLSRHNVFWSV
jgi:hypothetical protein